MEKYRYHTFTTLPVVVFILSLISCSSPEEVSVEIEKPIDSPKELPIGFRGLDVYSRAVDLATAYDNFCVRSVKKNADGTSSIVMPNYIIKKIDGAWTYAGLTSADGATQYLKYWDLSANSYTYAAVAPTSATGATFSIDNTGNFTIDLPDLATDWMIARTIRRGVNDASKLLDYDDIAENIDDIDNSAEKTSSVFTTPSAPCDEVPLNFHRILSKVVIKAYAEDEIELKPLEVGFDNIGIAPASYRSATGWTTTPLVYQQVYNQHTLITSEQNSCESAQLLTQLYVIPQQSTDAANNPPVQISVKTNNDEVHKLGLPTPWEPDFVYIYYLKFDGGAIGEVILMDVKVEPFAKGGEDEDKQTNW